MKSNLLSACRRALLGLAALATLGGMAGLATAQTPPYGTTWDCVLSGSGQQGIAFLTFSNDFTFTGYELLVGKQSSSSQSSSGTGNSDNPNYRPNSDITGRNDYSSTNAPVGSGTNLFGFGQISGPWHYDNKGRVIGYFIQIIDQQTTITTNYEIVEVSYSTNTPPFTTNVVFYRTNITYLTNTAGTTNGISFSAKVVSGKRLNLVSSTPNGKVTYKGVPQSKSPGPIAGSWIGNKKQNKQDIAEFFTLLPTAVRNIYYTTNGEGPGIKFGGVSMVSVQNKMGFAFSTFQNLGTNDVPVDANGNITGGNLSATIGGLTFPKKGTRANTKGFEQPISPVTFQAQRQGP